MKRSNSANEAIAYLEGYHSHSGEILKQYIEKLEKQLTEANERLESERTSINELSLHCQDLEHKLEKIKEKLDRIKHKINKIIKDEFKPKWISVIIKDVLRIINESPVNEISLLNTKMRSKCADCAVYKCCCAQCCTNSKEIGA